MFMNKIILPVILLLIITLSFCACSFKTPGKETTSAEVTSTTSAGTTAPDTTASDEDVTKENTENSDEKESPEDKDNTEDSTTKKLEYDKSMYEGLTDEEIELIVGALGEDFEFEGIDELSSSQISKIRKYAKSVGKYVKIRHGKMIFTDEDGNTVTTVSVTWPNGTLIEKLPTLRFGKITLQSGNDNEYAVTVTNFTKSNIEDYIKLLTSAGFSQGIEQIDDLENGVYSYSASTVDGFSVNLSVVTDDCLVITVKTAQQE